MNAFAEELDRVLHQPIRTRIVAYLVMHESCDFTSIKKIFDLNDGHMTTHMTELLESGYVNAEKILVDGKVKTVYSITKKGKKAFEEYVGILKGLIL